MTSSVWVIGDSVVGIDNGPDEPLGVLVGADLPRNPFELTCSDDFAEHCEEELVDGSRAMLFYNHYEGQHVPGPMGWYTAVVYDLKKGAPKNEIPRLMKRLEAYTQGQMSDGIGEGFEQNPFFLLGGKRDCYLQMWHKDQRIESFY